MRLKLLAVQMQAVITPTLKDCLPKSWIMKVALILLGWIPPAQTLKTPPYTISNPIHLNMVTCKGSTADQRAAGSRPILNYHAVLLHLLASIVHVLYFPMLKYNFNENNMLQKQTL